VFSIEVEVDKDQIDIASEYFHSTFNILGAGAPLGYNLRYFNTYSAAVTL
jgi:hypothetical protein